MRGQKMSNWYFFIISIFSVTSACALKCWFSGPKLNGYKYFLCVVFNCPFGFYYFRIVDSGCLAFQGCIDKTHNDYLVIGWVALVCAIMHACSFPTAKEFRYK